MVGDAMDDHGLVIESFSAPPDLAARGLTGQVLAQDVLGRVAAIRRIANNNSITVTDDVRTEGAESLKVEIPETGVSLGDVESWLHRKLGHAKRLAGEVSQDGAGDVAVELHLSGAGPIIVQGPAASLDGLVQQASEKAFAAFDPTNYVLYLLGSGRDDDALAAAGAMPRQPPPRSTSPTGWPFGGTSTETADAPWLRPPLRSKRIRKTGPGGLSAPAPVERLATMNRQFDVFVVCCEHAPETNGATTGLRSRFLLHLARARLNRELADYQSLQTEVGRIYPRLTTPSERLH